MYVIEYVNYVSIILMTKYVLGFILRFSQSEVMLHSNAAKYGKKIENKTVNVHKNSW